MRALPPTMLVAMLTLAGCVSPPSAEPGPSNPQPTAPVSADGSTEGLLCLQPAGPCDVLEDAVDLPLPTDRAIATFHANVTWTPRDPTLPDLEVFLLTIDENGDWTWEETPDTYWTGTSPLAIASALHDDAPQQYHVHARTRHELPDGSRAGASQSYHVEGVVTFR